MSKVLSVHSLPVSLLSVILCFAAAVSIVARG